MAGLDAGLVWNSYPKMGDNWIPEDVMRFEPAWVNLFENTSTVQFDHRLLGHATFAAISALWLMSRKAPLPPRVKITCNALLGMAIIQVGVVLFADDAAASLDRKCVGQGPLSICSMQL